MRLEYLSFFGAYYQWNQEGKCKAVFITAEGGDCTQCQTCQEYGHWARNCPTEGNEENEVVEAYGPTCSVQENYETAPQYSTMEQSSVNNQFEDTRPYVEESTNDLEEKEEITDPARLKMISRAVGMIKKSKIQKVARSQVVSFLTQKGMSESDIELAFNKAKENSN